MLKRRVIEFSDFKWHIPKNIITKLGLKSIFYLKKKMLHLFMPMRFKNGQGNVNDSPIKPLYGSVKRWVEYYKNTIICSFLFWILLYVPGVTKMTQLSKRHPCITAFKYENLANRNANYCCVHQMSMLTPLRSQNWLYVFFLFSL